MDRLGGDLGVAESSWKKSKMLASKSRHEEVSIAGARGLTYQG